MTNTTPNLILPPHGKTFLQALLKHHFPHVQTPLLFTELPQYTPRIESIIQQNYLTPEDLEILEYVEDATNNHIIFLVGILLKSSTLPPEIGTYLKPLLHTEVIRIGIHQIIQDTLGNSAQA